MVKHGALGKQQVPVGNDPLFYGTNTHEALWLKALQRR
jgi:hypothetical protein